MPDLKSVEVEALAVSVSVHLFITEHIKIQLELVSRHVTEGNTQKR